MQQLIYARKERKELVAYRQVFMNASTLDIINTIDYVGSILCNSFTYISIFCMYSEFSCERENFDGMRMSISFSLN